MEYFDRIIYSVINSLVNLPPTLPYFPLIPSVILYLIQSQKNHCNYVNKNFWLKEYDYVVIGAGSGGSVMASRLSEDASKTVLLLEAGLPENIVSDVPKTALMLQQTPIDWAFLTEPQNKSCFGLKGRRSRWPRGKVMGGSSVLNTMLYSRGNPRDYDKWAADGAEGWSWADIFPYFIKAEDNRDAGLVSTGYHGVGGPLTVTSETATEKASDAFRDSGPYLGYPIGNHNGPIQSVFEFPQGTIRNGERFSVANAYLQSLPHQRPNLHILNKAFVTKILFDDKKRAIGVKFIKNRKTRVVKVRGEVILSAGTIMSPKLLMLSGIGHSNHLKSLDIGVVADLPVGDNLIEHAATSLIFSLNQSVSYDFIKEITPWHILEYYVTKNNSLSSTILETMAFVKTKYANQTDDWPDIQLHVVPGSAASDYGFRLGKVMGIDRQLWRTFKPYFGLPTLTILPTLLRPISRGWIRLRSSDPLDPPMIDPKFFDHDHDLDVLVEGMKISLEVAQAPPLKRYGATPLQIPYLRCKQYKLYSDPYLRCMAQTFTSIIYHPMGTCKMGATNDKTAVVDTHLRVKGVTGLRVVDGSVIPSPVSGNINAPIVAIAEKCADHMRGRRITPFKPPMSQSMIAKLPELPFERIENF